MAKSIAFTEEAMRARFNELDTLIKAIEAESMPMREERDRIVNEARSKEKELNDAIHKIERGTTDKLFNLKQEQSMIVRALKGRVSGKVNIAKTSEESVEEVVE